MYISYFIILNNKYNYIIVVYLFRYCLLINNKNKQTDRKKKYY